MGISHIQLLYPHKQSFCGTQYFAYRESRHRSNVKVQ
jgi:hypothetical protein